MITEEYIRSVPRIALKDGVYLLNRSPVDGHKDYLSGFHVVDILVPCDVCPYCEAPFDGRYINGAGGWIYRKFACGVKAAFTPSIDRNDRLLLAVSRPTAGCHVASDIKDDII